MSIYATNHVWHYSRLKGTALLALLALADQANDQGVCWPSRATLAHKTRLSERTLQNLMPEILASGELVVVSEATGPGHPRVYRVVVPAAPDRAKGETSSPFQPRGPAGREKAAQQREKAATEQREKNLPAREKVATPKGENRRTLTGVNRVNRTPVEPPVNRDARAPRENSGPTLVGSEPIALTTEDRPDAVVAQLAYRVEQLADEFEDTAVASCIAQARRILADSQLEWWEFDNACKVAAHDTRQRRDDAAKPRLGLPMAYFFHALRTAANERRRLNTEATAASG